MFLSSYFPTTNVITGFLLKILKLWCIWWGKVFFWKIWVTKSSVWNTFMIQFLLIFQIIHFEWNILEKSFLHRYTNALNKNSFELLISVGPTIWKKYKGSHFNVPFKGLGKRRGLCNPLNLLFSLSCSPLDLRFPFTKTKICG